MDTIDQSDLEIENTLVDTILKNSSSGVPNGGLLPKGVCYNDDCESEVTGKKLFCNGECATAHHKASTRLRR